MALLLLLPALVAAQGPDDPLRILGFRRQLSGANVELIVACNGPVSFRYSSPTLETIRLLLPRLDPVGVTPPREAWGEDLAGVELRAASGAAAPGAVLELSLPAFRPYSIQAVGNELRIVLEGRAEAPLPAADPSALRTADPAPTPGPDPEPPPALEPDPGPPAPEPPSGAAASPAGDEELPFPSVAAEAPGHGSGVPGERELDDDAPPATRIFEVARADRDGALAIRIPADGRPAYQAFFTREGPLRLVLDFERTESRPLFQSLDVRVGPVRRVRVGQHAAEPVPIVRVVIDLDERVSHRIETDDAGLTLRFDGVSVEP